MEEKNLYLLFGDERFLQKHYADKIEKESGVENKDIFDGTISVAEIIMAAETFSFDGVSSKRLIFIRDSKLFASGRKAESEEMADYFSKIPNDTIMVFIESEVDKRTRIFKKMQENGEVVECATLSPEKLSKWIARLFTKKGKKISTPTINFLTRTCGSNMANLANECEKLFHYCENEITPQDILEICTPTLESRIFDLTKAVSAGRTADALKNYRDMLILKESPIMILSMVIRQLRIILLCKCHAEKNTPRSVIAKELNLRDFVVNEALSSRFTTAQLIRALRSCMDTDIRIKTGLLSPEIGVELLIIESNPS